MKPQPSQDRRFGSSERAVDVHDAGEQRALIEERAELGVGRRRLRQQRALALLGLPLPGDVAHDLRGADRRCPRRP